MNLGTVKTIEPEERRIPFQNPRLETIPTDNPFVGQIPIFVSSSVLTAIPPKGIGLILGSYGISNGVEFLEIERFAASPSPSSTDVPFSPKDWETILMDAAPGSLAIGWWISRTGDPALTPPERAHHKDLFPLLWQIAMIHDPDSGSPRFHQWYQSGIEECGYYIVQTRRK
jgi:hypothetical protein